MKLPIQYTLLYPDRLPGPGAALRLGPGPRLDLRPPRPPEFPCLALAYAALRAGGTAPAILNAANEEAVGAFLAGRAGFWHIQACVAEVLASIPAEPAHTLEQVMDTDRRARAAANAWIHRQPS